MNTIDNRIAIHGMATNFEARAKSEPHIGKLPAQDVIAKFSPDSVQFNMTRVSVAFSTYGSHGERVAIVVKNEESGEIIREIPAREIQQLYDLLSKLSP